MATKNLTNSEDVALLLKLLSEPKLEEGNMVIEIEDEEYQQWVQALKFSVVGKGEIHLPLQ